MILKRYFPVLAAALLFAACSNDNDADEPAQPKGDLSIAVGSASWGGQETRASYSAATEDKGTIDFPLSFTDGDAIGVFVVDANGKVTVANDKFTLSGSTWTAATPIAFADSLRGCTYYAYYPYKDGLTDAPAAGSTFTSDATTGTDDTSFFKDAISGWAVNADQSTLEGFTGSDLMTAKGTLTEPYVNELHISFTLHHRMGLLITKTSLLYRNENDANETWTVEQDFGDNKPYAIDSNSDIRYYIVKPDEPTTLGSKTRTLNSGEAEQLYFTNGEPAARDTGGN